MRWIKKGLIFKPDHNFPWMISHASIPVIDSIGDGKLRIYFSSRDSQGRSRPSYIEVDDSNPSRIVYIHDRPILPLGELGTFDDNGIMPSWIVSDKGTKYLYYIAWNPQVTVSYRLAIGLAISTDGGKTFEKYSDGPICDRDVSEPFFNTAPCVLKDGDRWRMWYVSCTGWRLINDRQEPLYNIKYAESKDGIHWRRSGKIIIPLRGKNEYALSKPFVRKENSVYKMWYSYRAGKKSKTYRIGYAESNDGVKWKRKDNKSGIDVSTKGWDSKMICYPFVFSYGKNKYMLYNGNSYGKTGFGLAILEKQKTI